MKYSIFLLAGALVFGSPKNAIAQSFTTVADTVHTTYPSTASNNITNKTGSNIQLDWRVKDTNFPADWLSPAAFGICDNYTCYNNTSNSLWNSTTSSGSTTSSLYYSNSIHDSTDGFRLSMILTTATPGTFYVTINLLDKISLYTKDITFITTKLVPSSVASNNTTREITLSPNPAQQATSLALTLGRAGDIQVNVTDMQGRIVKSLSKAGIAGPQTLEIATNDLAAGLYLVQVQADGQTSKEKLSVIK